MEGDLVVAFGSDGVEIAVPALARVDAQFLGRLALQQIPGAFDIGGGDRLAVVPFDALAQWQGQLGTLLMPGPAGCEFRDNRLWTVLRDVLAIDHKVVEDSIIARFTATVDSSNSDMLAGLSKWAT